MRINVKGGTNAGWRILKAAARDWRCPSCGKALRYYWTACPTDGHPRTEEV